MSKPLLCFLYLVGSTNQVWTKWHSSTT